MASSPKDRRAQSNSPQDQPASSHRAKLPPDRKGEAREHGSPLEQHQGRTLSSQPEAANIDSVDLPSLGLSVQARSSNQGGLLCTPLGQHEAPLGKVSVVPPPSASPRSKVHPSSARSPGNVGRLRRKSQQQHQQQRQASSSCSSAATAAPSAAANNMTAALSTETMDARQSRKKAPDSGADHGIAHTSRFLTNTLEELFGKSRKSTLLNSSGKETLTPLQVHLEELHETGQQKLSMALDIVSDHVRKLPAGSALVELGSRSGDIAIELALRHPSMRVQPVDGIATTSASIHLLLTERIQAFNREQQQEHQQKLKEAAEEQFASWDLPSATARRPPPAASSLGPIAQLLPIKRLRLNSYSTWAFELGRNVGALLAINLAQLLSSDSIQALLRGARRVLGIGGLIIFAGPFFNDATEATGAQSGGQAGGNHGGSMAGMITTRSLVRARLNAGGALPPLPPPSDSTMLYDAALRRFAEEVMQRRADVSDLPWRMPSAADVIEMAQQEGLLLLEAQKVNFGEGWMVLTFKQHLPSPHHHQQEQQEQQQKRRGSISQ